MRTPEKMYELILQIANEDERIRAVTLAGSRANRDCPSDFYQDFDITYYVKDVQPFWDNEKWIEEKFGKPLLMQKPESMSLIPPDNNGCFVYLMIFSDGNRIDLCIAPKDSVENGGEAVCEPTRILLDKDGIFSGKEMENASLETKTFWLIEPPSQKFFSDCCNEFHWCMNNVVKGIARDELSYAMEMLNHYVRDMLLKMLEWYVGAENGFKVSAGKCGKHLKRFLPAALYEKFKATYSGAETEAMWKAAFEMLYLFGEAARAVAGKLNFSYDEKEEKGIETYMNMVKTGALKFSN